MSDIINAIEALGIKSFIVDPRVTDEESFNNSYIEQNKQGEVSLEKGTPTITWKEVKTKLDALQAEENAQEYARKRKAEYPDWSVQLNKIYDDGLTKWKSEMVDPIKAKYPKP